MIKKFICLSACAATLLPFALHAQPVQVPVDTQGNITNPSDLPSDQAGNIKAFLVKGSTVTVTDSDGNTKPLKRGDVFREGTTVKTGTDSTAVLILSNGSSIRLGPDSELEITEFQQEVFDPAMGSYLTLTQDPSTSKTNLTLKNGTISGETKHLSGSSEYVVTTPLGSAGIRGTTFGATVSTQVVDGKTIVTVTFAKGSGTVTFEVPGDVSGSLGDGEEITVTGELNEDGTVTINNVTSPGPIDPAMQQAIEDVEAVDPETPPTPEPTPTPDPLPDPVIVPVTGVGSDTPPQP
jgi:hypothetical protein